jgi:hypothetical protein
VAKTGQPSGGKLPESIFPDIQRFPAFFSSNVANRTFSGTIYLEEQRMFFRT